MSKEMTSLGFSSISVKQATLKCAEANETIACVRKGRDRLYLKCYAKYLRNEYKKPLTKFLVKLRLEKPFDPLPLEDMKEYIKNDGAYHCSYPSEWADVDLEHISNLIKLMAMAVEEDGEQAKVLLSDKMAGILSKLDSKRNIQEDIKAGRGSFETWLRWRHL